MNDQDFKSITEDIEVILAAYANWLKRSAKTQTLRAFVNAAYYRVLWHSEGSFDSGNGYRLVLFLPQHIYDAVQQHWNSGEISRELNVFTEECRGDYFSLVDIAPVLVANPNWREESGALELETEDLRDEPLSFEDPITLKDDIWGEPGLIRMFISHKASNKVLASNLKSNLARWKISAFVAHNDITPTFEWQQEILKALRGMDCMLALMCAEFKQSDWTDQEVGVAMARGRFIIPVDMGQVPYGFIGKFQSINSRKVMLPNVLTEAIIKVMLKQERFRQHLMEPLANHFVSAGSFADAKTYMGLLESLPELRGDLANKLRSAVQSNGQVAQATSVPERLERFLANVRQT